MTTPLSPEISATMRAFLDNLEDCSAQIYLPANCVQVVKQSGAFLGATPAGKVVASTKKLAHYLAEKLS